MKRKITIFMKDGSKIEKLVDLLYLKTYSIFGDNHEIIAVALCGRRFNTQEELDSFAWGISTLKEIINSFVQNGTTYQEEL